MAVKTQKLQRVAFVIDESGSMRNLRYKVEPTYQSWLDTVRGENSKHDMQTEVTIAKFDNRVEFLAKNIDINDRMPVLRYQPDATTALMTAVRQSCDSIKSKYPEMTYLVIVITDGAENASSQEDLRWAESGIKGYQDTDMWTFVFLVPDQMGVNYLTARGVPVGNIKIWETSERGLERARIETQSSMSNYYTTRSTGKTSTKSFFSLTTDLSNVTKATEKDLVDLTNRYKLYNVDKEEKIKPFIEVIARRVFIKGENYYQLMKKEKVAFNKSIFLYNKKDKKIYGGDKVREILGMDAFKDYKVDPGNHADYDIFIRSDSDNRILPRGTKILVRL